MADNYLEKRYEELFGSGAGRKPVVKRVGQPLDTLLLRNRSHRAYKKEVAVTREQLLRIIGVNTKLPSARNQQVLRFRPVAEDAEVEAVLQHIRLGAACPNCSCRPRGRSRVRSLSSALPCPKAAMWTSTSASACRACC